MIDLEREAIHRGYPVQKYSTGRTSIRAWMQLKALS